MIPEAVPLRGLVSMGLGALIVTNGIMGREARAVEGSLTNLRPEIGLLIHEYDPNRIKRNLSGRRECTATLVTPDFVLTAAHCVDYSPDNPAEYTFFIYRSNKFFKYQLAAIVNFGETRHWDNVIPSINDLQDVPLHPTPTGRGYDDVALLHLAASVPADVATPSGVASWYPDVGETVTVLGYGGRCRLGKVGTADPSGFKRYASWTYQVDKWDPTNPQRNQPTALICDGDSGGPAVRGGLDDGGPIWGVASSSSSEWDWYGDVIYYRPLMDYIVTNTPQPQFRKDLVHLRPWELFVHSKPSILGSP
jgi:Trypsin